MGTLLLYQDTSMTMIIYIRLAFIQLISCLNYTDT